MPEAVIVATARSPIGRAFKGSLKDVRPDDLAAAIVKAALDKVPALDPRDIDDLMLLVRADVTSKNARRAKRYLAGYDRVEARMAEVEARDNLRNWQPPVTGEQAPATAQDTAVDGDRVDAAAARMTGLSRSRIPASSAAAIRADPIALGSS